MMPRIPGPSQPWRLTESSISPSHDTTFVFGNPTIKPERVYDFELGSNLKGDKYRAGLNLYWMEFRHEIVPNGGLDANGQPNVGNADRSVHAGIEFSGSWQVNKLFAVSGNTSYSYNRLKKYLEYNTDSSGNVYATNYSGNPTPGFPDYLTNLILDFNKDPFRLTYRLRAVGRQYVENGKIDSLSINPFVVSSVSSSISLGKIAGYGRFTLLATVYNLFNKKYESSGYAYEYSGKWYGEYFPAAERNFFLQLKWELE